MKRYQNEIKVGLAILLTIVTLYAGVLFLRDIPLLGGSYMVTAIYEKVDGLLVGNPVQIAGVKVGSVARMELVPEGVRVHLRIDRGIRIPRDSRALIVSTDLIGTKAVSLILGDDPEPVSHNGVLLGQYDEGFAGQLQQEARPIVDKTTRTLDRLSGTLQEVELLLRQGGREELQGTLTNLRSLTQSLAQILERRAQDLERAIEALRITAEQGAELTDPARLDSLERALQANLRDLRRALAGLEEGQRELNEILRKINQGQGTLGLLLNDERLYWSLDSTLVALRRLAEDVRQHPSRYTRGIVRIF
ncbi:MAG: MlaD family protein [Bacteroidetes bacterium]|nr:MlaD family protein [Rhodothermia bacterium]MCS7154332.1 MlaD family protein [Bacteroidota bacterium]MCX7906631.1 MlaD family protein [Bacteroidota bacterium]MDW8137088.1 MlaD family protein [Bacteroidota bacterium]MDW8285041.1 MlaD family protein [Bacteroidota bacterium]